MNKIKKLFPVFSRTRIHYIMWKTLFSLVCINACFHVHFVQSNFHQQTVPTMFAPSPIHHVHYSAYSGHFGTLQHLSLWLLTAWNVWSFHLKSVVLHHKAHTRPPSLAGFNTSAVHFEHESSTASSFQTSVFGSIPAFCRLKNVSADGWPLTVICLRRVG